MSRETAGNPFPKCFSAPTGLRRACGVRGGARGQVASAPCRHPPAELVCDQPESRLLPRPGATEKAPKPGAGGQRVLRAWD